MNTVIGILEIICCEITVFYSVILYAHTFIHFHVCGMHIDMLVSIRGVKETQSPFTKMIFNTQQAGIALRL
jgi:hypothetical protein